MSISAFLTLIFVICTGEYHANASVHSDPARVPGCTLGGEDEQLLSGSAFCSHSYRSSAHAHDWQALLCHGNEMCKCLSIFFRCSSSCHFICTFLCCNLICMCCSWTLMTPKWHLRRMSRMDPYCHKHHHTVHSHILFSDATSLQIQTVPLLFVFKGHYLTFINIWLLHLNLCLQP